MGGADLHLHTCYSDGLDAPEAVADRAAALGLQAIAITDHDTCAGIPEARSAAGARGLAFLAGIEISACFERMEVHVLGLGVAEAEPALAMLTERFASDRAARMGAILDALVEQGALPEAAAAGLDRARLSRMHIARLLRDRGVTRSAQEAFDRYLNPRRAAWRPKLLLPVAEAIAAIHAAGGLAFVAHPGLGRTLRRRLDALLEYAFDGIEAYHVRHSPGRTEELLTLARIRGLLVCGGSDCHGGIKGRVEMGRVRLPLAHYERIRERLGR